MVYVGIDVSKDKHDCCVIDSDGQLLFKGFSIANNLEGFDYLYEKILNAEKDLDKVKVGLEATGHYSYNILGYLLNKGLHTFVLNPLHTNLYRKSLTLRKTKTDKVDSRIIAQLLMSEADIKPYSITSYHNEELKSLTRYRFSKVRERGNLKQAVARLVNILFPELENLFSTLHIESVYAVLREFPGASYIANAHILKLTNILETASRGYYGRSKAEEIRDTARRSIGSNMPAKSLELKHTILLIQQFNDEIDEIENAIKAILSELNSPILTIPGMGFRMAAMILAEIGDINNFDSPDKILAYSGVSPTTYQSGKFEGAYAHMEKRGSRYLRFALYQAATYVCHWDPVFADYLHKKLSEGKHYYVAISHAIKKLIRVIYSLEKSHQTYIKAA